jgi:hypothetical protein
MSMQIDVQALVDVIAWARAREGSATESVLASSAAVVSNHVEAASVHSAVSIVHAIQDQVERFRTNETKPDGKQMSQFLMMG